MKRLAKIYYILVFLNKKLIRKFYFEKLSVITFVIFVKGSFLFSFLLLTNTNSLQ